MLTKDVPAGLRRLSVKHGVPVGELSKRFHRIKRRGRSWRPEGVNWIDDESGDVFDSEDDGKVGEYIGNVINDF